MINRTFVKLFLFLCFFNLTVTYAQKAISEGKVIYDISYPDMDLDSKMSGMLPTKSVVIFKGNKSRTETTMGAGMSSASIVDSKSGNVITLMDMMGNKIAMILTEGDIKKYQDGKDDDAAVIPDSATKIISGYVCKKAVIKGKDGNDFELFYTDKINAKSQLNLQFKNIKGFPMEYTISQKGLVMKLLAKSVSPEKVSDDLFEIPKDYQVKTMEEMMKMMGPQDGK